MCLLLVSACALSLDASHVNKQSAVPAGRLELLLPPCCACPLKPPETGSQSGSFLPEVASVSYCVTSTIKVTSTITLISLILYNPCGLSKHIHSQTFIYFTFRVKKFIRICRKQAAGSFSEMYFICAS